MMKKMMKKMMEKMMEKDDEKMKKAKDLGCFLKGNDQTFAKRALTHSWTVVTVRHAAPLTTAPPTAPALPTTAAPLSPSPTAPMD